MIHPNYCNYIQLYNRLMTILYQELNHVLTMAHMLKASDAQLRFCPSEINHIATTPRSTACPVRGPGCCEVKLCVASADQLIRDICSLQKNPGPEIFITQHAGSFSLQILRLASG